MQLLRVPGIGINSARKIIEARRTHKLDFDMLKKMRIVMKRAKYFITCDGKMKKGLRFEQENIKTALLLSENLLCEQLSIFDLQGKGVE
jgi:predicted DNA-binding helix-hairpin-helix protein